MDTDKEKYEEKEWVMRYRVYRSEDLPERYRRLVAAAREARMAAYCPYSRFAVGAAVLLENGGTVRGANQENAAYPSGLCAERTALFAAGAMFPGVRVLAMAVAGGGLDDEREALAAPCGACRQVMDEVARRQGAGFEVVLPDGAETYVVESGGLLPLAFGL